MARKIISKGGSTPKRQANTKGASNYSGESKRNNDLPTNCQHRNHQRTLDVHRRPFKSETNLFSSTGTPNLQLAGERNFSPDPRCQSTIVNANNGFIPISKSDENTAAAYEGDSTSKTNDGGSEVTMFKTKVLYHSRSDFRPIGLTGDQSNLTENSEQEANV